MSNLHTATKYFGCQIEVNGETGTMIAITCNGIVIDNGERQIFASHNYWKPILKPLSEITDEDAVEVARMADLPESVRKDRYYCDSGNMLLIGREISYDLRMDLFLSVPVTPIDTVTIIDFLRSRYYDIDNVLKP